MKDKQTDGCKKQDVISCHTVLDLFSGIGGFSLGLERTGGFKTIAFCEIEKFPRSILRKHWPAVPIFKDVRKLHAEDLPCLPDVITGGYPCQPFSVAGKRRGKGDDRHLWPEIIRIIRELDAAGKKPTWGLFENVAGHISMGLDQVLADLEREDYACWPLVIPACAVNAPHRRDRVWILAHTRCLCGGNEQQAPERRYPQAEWCGNNCKAGRSGQVSTPMANAMPQRLQKRQRENSKRKGANSRTQFVGKSWRLTESPVCAADDGIPGRVARLKALGNAVVPQIPEIIGYAILSAGRAYTL